MRSLSPERQRSILPSHVVNQKQNYVRTLLFFDEEYFDGVVPAAGELTEYDRETLKEFSDVKAEVEKLLDVFKFRDAQKEAMNLARIGNKYLADTEPWKIAKTDKQYVI